MTTSTEIVSGEVKVLVAPPPTSAVMVKPDASRSSARMCLDMLSLELRARRAATDGKPSTKATRRIRRDKGLDGIIYVLGGSC